MTHGNEQAKETLRRSLQMNAQRFGLTPRAIDSLVAAAIISRVAPGIQIFDRADTSDFITYLVAGVARVGCTTPDGSPMTLLYAKSGQFVATGWLGEQRPPQRTFGAVAHTAAIVAMWSQQSVMEVVAALEPRRAFQLMAFGWRAFSSLLHQKFRMLPMSLRDRVVFQLKALARDFGRPIETPPGVLIQLVLTQQELADLVVAQRSSVSRCLGVLRKKGLYAMLEGHFMLTARGLSAPPAL